MRKKINFIKEKAHPKRKILAVASAGGHWVQLLRLKPSWEGHEVEYVSTIDDTDFNGVLHVVTDANQHEKFKSIQLFFEMFWILIKTKPDFVVSTGALPGLIAIMIGRFLGIQTIWLDSIANAEQLSKSGRMARKFAGIWLTQWPELAKPTGPYFWGRVL